jgi:predicted nucleotidyltransferase
MRGDVKMEERMKLVTSEVNDELLKLFGDKIERIILYGSYARGDFDLESDIDIMILLNCDQKEILENRKAISQIASRVGLKNDVMVSLLARNCTEYESNMKYQPFYQNIEKEGVKVYG